MMRRFEDATKNGWPAVSRLVGLLVLTMALHPARSLGQSPTWLFSAEVGSGGVVELTVIGSVTGGRLDSLPMEDPEAPGGDQAAKRLRAALFVPGRRYWLYGGRGLIGAAAAMDSAPTACTGLSGTARAARLPPGWIGLAASDSTLAADAGQRPATLRELARLRRAAEPVFDSLGAGSGAADRADVLAAWAIEDERIAVHTLLGAFRIREDGPYGPVIFSAFFALEDTASAPTAVWTHRALEDEAWTQVPLGMLDIDHDGQPELVTRTTYAEAFDYALWRRRDGRWVLWHAQLGGAGC